jgi:hypothetical protein
MLENLPHLSASLHRDCFVSRVFILTILLCGTLNFFTYSQEKYNDYNGPAPEKIYLQLDGKVYTTDKTVWFKSIVAAAGDHYLSELSRVLYVELIGPDGKIKDKKIVKLEKGIGTGHFDLNPDYTEGNYLVRAYTNWARNFGSDFFFDEYIQVFSPGTKPKQEPLSNISLIENNNNKHQLNATLDPFVLDSLHKQNLTVIITTNHITDTLHAEKTKSNNYTIDYRLPDSSQFITLKILTSNNFSFTKRIVLDEDHFDLQFFPESGELVDGISTKVGFKAMEFNGKGRFISGEITNSKGTVLTTFRSNHAGMGCFFLNNPHHDSTYFARIKSQFDSTMSNLYPLPIVAVRGNVLSVSREKDELHLTCASNYMCNDSIFIKVSCRGFIYYDVKGKLTSSETLHEGGSIGKLSFSLPTSNLPDGIIAITMMDYKRQPVAERLVFIENTENRLTIDITADTDSYAQRDLTRLNIITSNIHGEPVPASISLLVLNKEQMGTIQNMRQNILSYFLINSDLKGDIENPGSYFSGKSNYEDLDALMLTQGWSKYLYNKEVNLLGYQHELQLRLSGSVSGIASLTKKKGAELTMMTFGKKKNVQTLITDSLGKFNFNLNDEYGQKVNILIQSANHSGVKKEYTISIDKIESPAVVFNQVSTVDKVDTVIKKLVEKNIELKKIDETYKLSKGIMLGEVKVEAYRMTPARKKVMQEYGKPKEVISGETILENEEKWSYGIYSVIQSKFPQIRILRYGAELIAEVRNSAPTLVVVDGRTVDVDNFGMVGYIPAMEVSSFEIIENVSNRSKVWEEFWSPYKSPEVPKSIDIISIYTNGGNGFFSVKKTKGIFKGAVSVFSIPREFYSPKYENLKTEDWYKPDLRALIYWEPKLSADSLGRTSATFYNSDNTGKVEVVVEAISEDGKIGYQELEYKVKERSK